MSLINNLLTNLESRQSSMQQNNDLVLDGLYSAYDVEITENHVITKKPYVLLFILAAVISLFVWLEFPQIHWYQAESARNNNEYVGKVAVNSDDPVTAVVHQKEVPAAIKKENWSLPSLKLDDLPDMWPGYPVNNTSSREESLISDISMQHVDNNIVLSFDLPAEVDYRVYTLELPYRAVVELNNVNYTGGLPQIESFPEITNIRKRMDDRGIFIFVLESTNPLSILNTDYQQSDNKYELQILLSGQHETDIATKVNPDSHLEAPGKASPVFSEQTITKGELVKTPNELSRPSVTDKLLLKSQQLYQQGNIAEGLDVLYAAVKENETHLQARATLALRLVEQGQHDLAISVLEDGLKKFPTYSDWAELLARIYLDLGQLELARSVLETSKPSVAEDPEYHALYAAILQQMALHEKAALTYQDLVNIRPENGIWWMGFAISLEGVSRNKDAVFAYRNALNGQSLTPESHRYIIERIRYLDNQLRNESS